MMYHTVLIVLHRPPLFLPTPTTAPDFTICWTSVTAIIKLIRHYSRGNEYAYLPVTFIHTATAVASIISMKRHTLYGHEHERDSDETAKYLSVVLEALEGCSGTWAAAAQAKEAIVRADQDARRARHDFCQQHQHHQHHHHHQQYQQNQHRQDMEPDQQNRHQSQHQAAVDDLSYGMGQCLELEPDAVMGGMPMGYGVGMGGGGVAGFLDPEYWSSACSADGGDMLE